MAFSWRTSLLIAGLLLCLFIPARAQQAPDTRPQSFPMVTIPNSEVRALKSTATGRGYDLYIHVPAEYAQHKEKKYPVLYVLDGQWDFKLMDSVFGGLLFDKFVPEMMIVGITYTGANPDYNALRAMDLTPQPASNIPGSGDAPKFLAFLKGEVMPFIEANYPANPQHRVLLGSSFGGLFTLYTMFTEPGLFAAYVAASPAVPYADRAAFKLEAEFAAKHKDLPVRLFISVGDSETLTQPVKEYAKILSARGYKGLKMEARVIEGERHAGNKPEAFNRGLRFVFRLD